MHVHRLDLLIASTAFHSNCNCSREVDDRVSHYHKKLLVCD